MEKNSGGRPIRVRALRCPSCGRNDWWMLEPERERQRLRVASAADLIQIPIGIVDILSSMLRGMLLARLFPTILNLTQFARASARGAPKGCWKATSSAPFACTVNGNPRNHVEGR